MRSAPTDCLASCGSWPPSPSPSVLAPTQASPSPSPSAPQPWSVPGNPRRFQRRFRNHRSALRHAQSSPERTSGGSPDSLQTIRIATRPSIGSRTSRPSGSDCSARPRSLSPRSCVPRKPSGTHVPQSNSATPASIRGCCRFPHAPHRSPSTSEGFASPARSSEHSSQLKNRIHPSAASSRWSWASPSPSRSHLSGRRCRKRRRPWTRLLRMWTTPCPHPVRPLRRSLRPRQNSGRHHRAAYRYPPLHRPRWLPIHPMSPPTFPTDYPQSLAGNPLRTCHPHPCLQSASSSPLSAVFTHCTKSLIYCIRPLICTVSNLVCNNPVRDYL